jgi:hypothetical protein
LGKKFLKPGQSGESNKNIMHQKRVLDAGQRHAQVTPALYRTEKKTSYPDGIRGPYKHGLLRGTWPHCIPVLSIHDSAAAHHEMELRHHQQLSLACRHAGLKNYRTHFVALTPQTVHA